MTGGDKYGSYCLSDCMGSNEIEKKKTPISEGEPQFRISRRGLRRDSFSGIREEINKPRSIPQREVRLSSMIEMARIARAL